MPVYNVFKQLTLSILIFFAFYQHAHADTIFSINNPKVIAIGNGHILQADILYPLTPRVVEAIDNGVPITFFQEIELYHSLAVLGDLWDWETAVWSTQLRYELRYHALAERYILVALDTHEQLSFQSLQEALKTMGEIRNLNLPPEHLTDTKGLKLKLRSGLDLHALPTPMRPGALLSKKWQLDSPWVEATWQ